MASTLSEEKVYLFEKAPVAKAIATLAVPTVISQLITTAYNLADTLFVGQLNDPDQVAAIALAMPVQLSLTALGNLFGIGGSTMFSRSLGAKDTQAAKKITSFAVYGVLAVMILYSVLVGIFKEPFLGLLGVTPESPELYSFTNAYVFWVLMLGGIPSTFNMVIGHLIRAEGASKEASFGLSMGCILNMILDPVFIFQFGFGLGLEGAAIATFISNCATTVYFAWYLYKIRNKTVISLSPRHFTMDKTISVSVLQIGLPSALTMLLSSVSNMVLNNVIVGYDSAAIAAIGICKKVDSFPAYTLLGITQGVVPLLAYNHGAKNHDRLKKSMRCTIYVAIGIALLYVLVLQVAPAVVASWFIKDEKTIEYAAMFIRIHCVSMPFAAIGHLLVGFFQAIKKSRQATVLSVIRKGIFDVPMMFILNAIIPLYGPVMCQPIMDAVAAACALIMYRKEKRDLTET